MFQDLLLRHNAPQVLAILGVASSGYRLDGVVAAKAPAVPASFDGLICDQSASRPN
jgi:hypothetical protein